MNQVKIIMFKVFTLIIFLNNLIIPLNGQNNSLKVCKNYFYTNLEKENLKITNNNRKQLTTNDYRSIRRILDCGVELANINDTVAENYILNYLDKIYTNLTVASNEYNIDFAFTTLRDVLQKLPPSNRSFNIGMKYFGLNIPYTTETVNDQCIEHYGCMIFEFLLLWMIHEDQLNHYMLLYYDNDFKDVKSFHSYIYPIIKKDWESGKIKLRKSSKE